MRRASRGILVALLTLTSCIQHSASPHVFVMPPRVAVLAHTLAWFHDTIPLLRFEPPIVYGAWRLAVEQCSGVTREGWPAFYLAPLPLLTLESGSAVAFYTEATHGIVFSLGAETHAGIVMHELLHWLLEPRLAPEPDDESGDARTLRYHPPEYFVERCGALLSGTP